MKKHLKKLRPLVLLAVLFMLTNCQEEYDDHSQENSQHASDMQIVTKPFKDFEELPGLIEKAIPNRRLKAARNIYDFKIDSTEVMQITNNEGTYYTMGITRDYAYGFNMFENLVISKTSKAPEAFIASYLPDPEFNARSEAHTLPAFKGGFNITKIDYNSLKKNAITTCVTFNILFCNWEDPEGHKKNGSCNRPEHHYFVPITRCTTWITSSPLFTGIAAFNNRVNIQPGLGGGGGTTNPGGGGTDPGTPTIPDKDGIGVAGPVTPGIKGPVTGPINPNSDPHEKNCKELADMMDRTGIRASFNDLNTKTGESKENGYKFEDGKTPKPLKLQAGTINHMELESGGQIYGGSHTHPDPSQSDYIPMFSLPDIVKLGQIAYNYKPLPGQSKNIFKCVITLTVKTANGNETYALKIEDWYQFGTYILQYDVLSKDEKIRKNNALNRKYTYRKEHGGGMDNYLKDLFNFMADQNIKGVAIYKANADFSEWSKQEYNPQTKTITPKPCN
ncbi:hypothetical protein D3C87_249670 [compost metagenome]